ncbi:MAG: formylglycine-generating enzyme family protein [Anaerolineae bacterium]|nr:formylglycine-generating enzyme family protein [Anaerolineae bacterium]
MIKFKQPWLPRVTFLLIAASLVLVSCQPVSPAATQPAASETAAPTAPPTATAIPPTATPTLPPTPTIEPTQANFRITEKDLMEQIFIPAGEFLMGSKDNDAQVYFEGNGVAYPEVPQHTLMLESYWIDKYEVTNGQYAACVADGTCKPPYLMGLYTQEHYYDDPAYSNYPVVHVDWWMASAYCTWAGRRLPTEAEWEKAARGTDGRRYPWGNDKITSDKANFCDKDCPRAHANPGFDDGYPMTAPVGSFPAGASAYGVMDLSGNVWEWTSTIPQPYPYNANDGREDQDAYAQRIWRGGTWTNGEWWIRATTRYRSVQKYWFYSLGFRCASSQ